MNLFVQRLLKKSHRAEVYSVVQCSLSTWKALGLVPSTDHERFVMDFEKQKESHAAAEKGVKM